MKYPVVLSSDQHFHAWDAFSKVNPDGVNSRLRIIIDEMHRSVQRLKDNGGDTMILAGDLFHQRGQIKPSVFNPAVECFSNSIFDGVSVYAIPGNHDLEGKDADKLGNAMQTLDQLPGFHACLEPTFVGDFVIFPWYQKLDDLRAEMRKHADKGRDAVIHAPVNEVIIGIPNHGLDAKELADMGYRRVFAGHYHNHVVFEDGKVVSIGATTHQTWSDPGTKAGFLLVWPDRIEHVPSAAPSFVDLNIEMLDAATQVEIDAQIADFANGNYVRLKLTDVDDKEINDWRKDLENAGAAGVTIIATKKNAVSRTGAAQQAAISLGSSVEHYVRNDMKPLLIEEVSKEAQDILAEAMQ